MRTSSRMAVTAVAAVAISAAGLAATRPAYGAPTPPVASFTPGLPLFDNSGSNTKAAEPSIRVDALGHVYVTGPVGVPTGGCPLWRLHPGTLNAKGLPYEYLGKFDTEHDSIGGGDCDSATGGLTGASGATNLAVSSLSLANLTTNQSGDLGTTFRTPANPIAVQSTDVDRQWNAADSGLGQVYMTVHDTEDEILVSASTDGGYTYLSNSVAIDPTLLPFAARDNHFGGIVVNPATHFLYTVFAAPTAPHGSQNAIYVAVGNPCAVLCTPGQPLGPISWTDHLVYQGAPTDNLAHDFPVIAIDAGGAVYAGWTSTQHVYVSHASQPGVDGTWSKPVQVDTVPLHSTMFPWLVGGRSGALDVVFYGAQLDTSTQACPPKASGTNGDSNGVNNNCHDVWTVQFAQSLDGGTAYTDSTASAVNHVGSICDQGTLCLARNGDRTLLDFFQVALDPSGAANIAYTADTSQVTYTLQCGGLSATTGKKIKASCAPLVPPPSPPGTACSGTNLVTDPSGDARNPLGLPTDTSTADITAVSFSSDAVAKTLTTTLRLSNLSLAPVPGTLDTYYDVVWTGPDGTTLYATQAAEPDPTGQFAYFYGTWDDKTNQFKTSSAATGSFTAGRGGTISITVPLSGIGTPAIPVTSPPAAVNSPYALTFSGYGVLGSGLVFVAPDDRAPNTGGGPSWSVCPAGSTPAPTPAPTAAAHAAGTGGASTAAPATAIGSAAAPAAPPQAIAIRRVSTNMGPGVALAPLLLIAGLAVVRRRRTSR